jgi:SET domain-containing protein
MRRSQESKNVTPDFVPKNPWREDEIEFSQLKPNQLIVVNKEPTTLPG